RATITPGSSREGGSSPTVETGVVRRPQSGSLGPRQRSPSMSRKPAPPPPLAAVPRGGSATRRGATGPNWKAGGPRPPPFSFSAASPGIAGCLVPGILPYLAVCGGRAVTPRPARGESRAGPYPTALPDAGPRPAAAPVPGLPALGGPAPNSAASPLTHLRQDL